MSEANKAIARRLWDVWHSRDLDKLGDLIAEDHVNHDALRDALFEPVGGTVELRAGEMVEHESYRSPERRPVTQLLHQRLRLDLVARSVEGSRQMSDEARVIGYKRMRPLEERHRLGKQPAVQVKRP